KAFGLAVEVPQAAIERDAADDLEAAEVAHGRGWPKNLAGADNEMARHRCYAGRLEQQQFTGIHIRVARISVRAAAAESEFQLARAHFCQRPNAADRPGEIADAGIDAHERIPGEHN